MKQIVLVYSDLKHFLSEFKFSSSSLLNVHKKYARSASDKSRYAIRYQSVDCSIRPCPHDAESGLNVV